MALSVSTDNIFDTLNRWNSFKKNATEIRILGGEFSGTRLMHVVYDETNESKFEARICITCGSRSNDNDAEKTLRHELSCRKIEIVVAIGDHIGVEKGSCFEGLKIRDMRRIFIAAQLAQRQTELEEKGTNEETIEKILLSSIPDGFSYEKSPITIEARHLNW